MTIQECINNLKMAYGMPNKKETKTMAIRSLEAWEKVVEDFENELDYYQNQPAPRNANAKYVQQAIISAYTDAIDTIKKHLQGVEE